MSLQNTINAPTDSAGWIPYTTTITASGTDPTPGAGFSSVSHYMLQGKLLHLIYIFSQNVAGSAGSGTYYFNIPSGFTADLSVSLPAVGGGGASIGFMYAQSTLSYQQGQVVLIDSSRYLLAVNTGFVIGSSNTGLNNSFVIYSANVTFSIT